MTFTPEELTRYSRQITLPEVSVAGQDALREASVLIVGAGGLGSPSALYLAAAGVGRIGLIDFDKVDLSNLHRQILYSTDQVGTPKTESAHGRLAGINPQVNIETFQDRLTPENAERIMGNYDVILDGTDNFPTRYLVNDACVRLGKPNVYGSVFRFEGQASVFDARHGPCYRCIYPEPPPPAAVPNCAEGGVLGVLPGLIGVIQATEAIKLILNQNSKSDVGEALIGRLLVVDALAMKFREFKIRKDPACPICNAQPSIRELKQEQIVCNSTKAENQMKSTGRETISATELQELLEQGEPLTLIDVREPFEYEICRIPGATLIPMNELQARQDEISLERPAVLYCHSGMRSAMAQQYLLGQGFKEVINLEGGIDAWSTEVDPSVPRY